MKRKLPRYIDVYTGEYVHRFPVRRQTKDASEALMFIAVAIMMTMLYIIIGATA